MSLPALRLSFLRAWPSAPDIKAGLRRALEGTTIVLPEALGQEERETIIDLLALFLDMPLRVVPSPDHARPGELTVVALAIPGDPPQAPEKGIVVCEKRRAPKERHLDLTHQFILLRDAIAESVGRRHSGTRLQYVGSWITEVAETPGAALRFASGALVAHIDNANASDAALYVAGLAAEIGWLVRGVDSRVVEWVIALATGAPHPGRLVSADALLLGEEAARQRAFEAGLVLLMPEEPGDSVELRRPLQILRHGDGLSVPITLEEVAKALKPVLPAAAGVVFDRLLRPKAKPLGLEGPSPVSGFRGREETIARLAALFEPAHDIRTTVLYGVGGIGKRQVAAALCELLAARFEPVWVRFNEGREAGWLRVAGALGVDTSGQAAQARDRAGVPRWVRKVHDDLRFRPCLLVVEGADTLLEDEVPAWLPSGEGTSCVLVLSSRAERALQRANEAVAVRLGGLPVEASRRLLAEKVPRLGVEILRGDADTLIAHAGGHPGVLSLAAGLLDPEHKSLAEVTEAVRRGEQAIPEVLREVIGALPDDQAKLVRALAVCAPAGSPLELALAIADLQGGKDVLDRLVDRAMVLRGPRVVRLAEVVRIEAERRLDKEPQARREVESLHARAVDVLFKQAREQGDVGTREDLYADLRVAVERLTAWVKGGARGMAQRLASLAQEILGYEGGEPAENARLAVEAYKAAVAIQPEATPWQWNLSIGYDNVGNASSEAGDTAGALASYQAARAIRERFARQNPGDANWQTNLSLSYTNIGDVLRRQGDMAAALAAYRVSQSLDARLVQHGPENGQWQINLSASHDRIGDVLLQQGDTTAAMVAYRAGFDIRERLARDESANSKWQRALYVSYSKIGHALLAQADQVRALEAYRAGLAIMVPLARQAPTNTEWQRDLSVSYGNIGNVLCAQGDTTGALSAHRTAYAIFEDLAQRDPTNPNGQHDLAIAHEKIGNVLLAEGDISGARAAYQASLVIHERLARLDPANVEWQADLAELSWKLSGTLDPVDLAEARALLERARRILRDLAASGRLTHDQQQWLPQIEARLASLPAETPRSART